MTSPSLPLSSPSPESAAQPPPNPPISGEVERVYFVPYRWWKDAVEVNGRRGVLYAAAVQGTSGPMRLINSIISSDIVFTLKEEEEEGGDGGEEEVGVSGRDYALVSGDMWLQALKWHSDKKSASKHSRSFSSGENDIADVYPLQLRLSALCELNSLRVKISKKDNAVELFKRACKIFNADSELMHIRDFSGRISLLIHDRNTLLRDSQSQTDLEIVLELQIYGLSDSPKCREAKRDDILQSTDSAGSSSGASVVMNGSTGGGCNFPRTDSSTLIGRSTESGSLGLTGLQNLGNTCFMNSALQCLAHTPKLVDFFLGDYKSEINYDNPLGMEGEIALAFGDLVRMLWTPGATTAEPRTFKSTLARFAPQFSGYNQHDSQELLVFLLDGLHEDLNRVKCKPYIEVKDGEGRQDAEVADEYWNNHLARNNSIIVDVCQGQYKSTLVCPLCKKVSITFDPFMYLSLPLPSTRTRTMNVTVMNSDGSSKSSSLSITVPQSGKLEDLTRVLSDGCSLAVDETVLVAEIFAHRIIRFLEDPTDSLTLIRDGDRLVAYRLPRETENSFLVVFVHQQKEERMLNWKAFGVPLIARTAGDAVTGSDIRDLYLKLLSPFIKSEEGDVGSEDTSQSQHTAVEETANSDFILALPSSDLKQAESDDLVSPSETEFEFYITDAKGNLKVRKLEMSEQIKLEDSPRRLYVIACWPEERSKLHDNDLPASVPEVYKFSIFPKKPPESVSLYKCLEAFLKEEPLGPEDMWYCPECKEHRQASKKLDLWRLPEILVIHLKRFSYDKYLKNKLETFVDFPVQDLDLGSYIANVDSRQSTCYMLYAISNHYGGLGSGHYTAFVHHGGGQWYDFDDSHVCPISEEKIKTSAAYVLFYRRVADP
ncbi:Ubiquitin carboxyl-terminal hydrolase 8-like protein [Drosera capensis]